MRRDARGADAKVGRTAFVARVVATEAGHGWATCSRLQPIIKLAKMLQRHLENILNYFRHRITNAMSEGFNSRIQSIKTQARGFRTFENFRTRILFNCGKLDLLPEKVTH